METFQNTNIENNPIEEDPSLEYEENEEFQELVKLEIRNDVEGIIRSAINPAIDDTFIRKLSKVMLNAKNEDMAFQNWRNILFKNSEHIFTPPQIDILNIDPDTISTIYKNVQDYKTHNTDFVKERMIERIQNVHEWNNRYEKRQNHQKRSLETLRRQGIFLEIPFEDRDVVMQDYDKDDIRPISEKIKGQRIFNINGLKDSKISVSIHDIFDHFWMYDTLDKLNFFEEYKDFFDKVGNPQNTDIFKREGELIASICFNWRSSHNEEKKFSQLFNLERIKKIMKKAQAYSTSNLIRAEEILHVLESDSPESKSLESIVSGVIVEMMEQRRKHGFIQKLNADYKPQGTLALLDPEYISLIIEINHLLSNGENEATQALLKTEVAIEDYLLNLARDKDTQKLTLTMEGLNSFNIENSSVKEETVQWLQKNIFHSSTRAPII